VEIMALVVMSLRSPPAIGERLQVMPVVGAEEGQEQPPQLLPGSATVADLQLLAIRLLGVQAAQNWLQRNAQERKRVPRADESADAVLLQSLERELANALGASSARMALTSVLRGAGLHFN